MDVLPTGCLAQPPASRIVQLDLADSLDIAAVIHDSHWEINQLQPGEFHGSAVFLHLDTLRISKLNINRPALHRLRCSPQGSTVLIRDHGSSEIFVESRLLRPSECVLLQSGREIDILSRGEAAFTIVSIREAIIGGGTLYCAAGKRPQLLRVPAQVLMEDSACQVDIPTCIECAEMMFRRSAHSPSASAQASLARRLLARIVNLTAHLSSPEENAYRPIRRHVGVGRARNYIREHLCEPIKLADLCQHAHVQERSLEYGFREITGLRPMAYIKMLRLCQVRRRLLTEADMECNISQLALDCGLSHLGQFATDYKWLFRESPSATRNRTRLRYRRAAA